ncbi:hypothetical protein U5801_21045 [Lamprobacter modestohalophilus]|uniref:hypothetical protein n=1 Tax=Lamprobacter modestohalophilus TaxID=1064514 RepID=UPI002ADEF4A1|nr:hypothetical protein [Lamprobacter modestohalophilus]MEA1052270.1 hypothetical protein [Lamprobacter modestohalophilus]
MSGLIKCNTCNNPVAISARNCPHCGEINFNKKKILAENKETEKIEHEKKRQAQQKRLVIAGRYPLVSVFVKNNKNSTNLICIKAGLPFVDYELKLRYLNVRDLGNSGRSNNHIIPGTIDYIFGNLYEIFKIKVHPCAFIRKSQ